jgi:hypothetical protein
LPLVGRTAIASTVASRAIPGTTDCWAKEPNGSAGPDKRRGDNDSRGSSSFKKPKASDAAAAVASEPGRIIEIPEDQDEDLDVDIWA